MNAAAWRLTPAAAALMVLVAGSRTAFGLFLSPLNPALRTLPAAWPLGAVVLPALMASTAAVTSA